MAITTDPTTPIAGAEVTLASSAAGGQSTRWKLTAVPSASELATGLLYLADGATFADAFTPDVPGEYAFTAYGYASYPSAATFDGDTLGDSREILVGSESATVHVAGYADLRILTDAGVGATLRLTVLDETIVEGEFLDHTDASAESAALRSAVTAALTAIEGVAVSALATGFISAANDLRTKFAAHLAQTIASLKVHDSDDTINAPTLGLAYSVPTAIELTNHLATKIAGHLGLGAWHNADTGDTENRRVTPLATTLGAAFVLLTDLRWRVYTPHRTHTTTPLPNLHDNADNTNTLTAVTTLETLISAFLSELVDDSTTQPTGEPEGIFDLVSGLGFTIPEV